MNKPPTAVKAARTITSGFISAMKSDTRALSSARQRALTQPSTRQWMLARRTDSWAMAVAPDAAVRLLVAGISMWRTDRARECPGRGSAVENTRHHA
jgi:hypothetical protein